MGFQSDSDSVAQLASAKETSFREDARRSSTRSIQLETADLCAEVRWAFLLHISNLLFHAGRAGGLMFIVEIAVTQAQYGFVIPRLFALRESTNVSAIM
jgi:hypothetical protein